MRVWDVEIDEGNLEHVTAHGVSELELRQVFANGITKLKNHAGSAAWVGVGATDGGRQVFVAYNETLGVVRPITAWGLQ